MLCRNVRVAPARCTAITFQLQSTLATCSHSHILSLVLSLVLLAGVFWCRRNEALHVGEHDLQVYLKSLHNQLESVALHPDPAKMVRAAC